MEIPTFNYLNNKLEPTGWKITYVDRFISTYRFAYLISKKLYPVNFDIRSQKNIFYSPEPDFIHDVLGHVPMLFYSEFRDLIYLWAQQTIKQQPTFIDRLFYKLTFSTIEESKKENKGQEKINVLREKLDKVTQKMNLYPSRIWRLGNFFDWSFEFGIVKTHSASKIFGGAIITSADEINYVCDNLNSIQQVRLSIFNKGINYAETQKKYFCVNNFIEYKMYLENLSKI
jgi:phenylalanine-4-hydroxylase